LYRKLRFVFLIILVIMTSFLAACSSSTKITSSTTTDAIQTTKTIELTTQPLAKTTKPSTTSALPTTSTTVANWWDKLGVPKYGGTLNWRLADLPNQFDPYNYISLVGYQFEGLFMLDWKLDRSVWDFKSGWNPPEYWTGLLAESWEWPDQQTMIIHLRKGVHWQNKAPLNGREFTAYDVEYHFDRVLGTGHGFTEPDPYYKGWIGPWEKATATDKYTIEFKFKNPSAIINLWSMFEKTTQFIEAPESVEQNLLKDWQDTVGTGPWMLIDYVTDSSLELTKNPNYWGVDERHPNNKLPYVDNVKVLRIADIATSTAALRTGKIDFMDSLDWQQAKTILNTNPELQQSKVNQQGFNLMPRDDLSPFTDIKVREALQMSLDLATIAKSHYGGTVDGKPAGMISPAFKGYVNPYDQWPQELQNEFSYNVTEARKLMTEAGYPNGFKTNCLAISTMDMDLLQIIKAYFLDIGVDMEINTMEFGPAFALVRAGKTDGFWMWYGAGTPPLIAIENNVSKVSLAHHNDLAFDVIVEKFRKSTTTAEAQQYVKEADMYWIQHHYTIETFPRASFTLWQPYLRGFSGEFDAGNNPYYWARFWINRE
jgi:peptide/nickel transport system substrate-binding protein